MRYENTETKAHTLTVVNAVDVPEAVHAEVMRLLAPYDPDTYTRPCDSTGKALSA